MLTTPTLFTSSFTRACLPRCMNLSWYKLGRTTEKQVEKIKKPLCITQYNKNMRAVDIDVTIPLRRVSTAQRQNTQHSQHATYYQPRYPTRKTIYPRSWAA